MSTRNRKRPNPTSETPEKSSKRVENSWTLLVKESLLENSNFSIITLPHPAYGTPSKFCLDDKLNKMYEVVTFDESHRSWFIGEAVKSDGSLLILTPVNPTYLVLPRLRDQCSTRAVPLEDLLSEKGFDKLVEFVVDLDKVADLKGQPDMKAYKFNEEKTLEWLEGKVRKLAEVLKDKKIHVGAGAVSDTFVTSQVNGESMNQEFYLKYAHGLLSEYLQEDLKDLLEKRFNFTPDLVETLAKKRKSDVADNLSINKKIKSESQMGDSKEDVLFSSRQSKGETKKQKPLSSKEKSRQKAASGTKTISSFFTKK